MNSRFSSRKVYRSFIVIYLDKLLHDMSALRIHAKFDHLALQAIEQRLFFWKCRHHINKSLYSVGPLFVSAYLDEG